MILIFWNILKVEKDDCDVEDVTLMMIFKQKHGAWERIWEGTREHVHSQGVRSHETQPSRGGSHLTLEETHEHSHDWATIIMSPQIAATKSPLIAITLSSISPALLTLIADQRTATISQRKLHHHAFYSPSYDLITVLTSPLYT